jgi:predicted deacylase
VTNMDVFEIGSLRVKRGERGFTRLPVTSLLLGAELSIPLHVIHGAQEGPVLGLISGIHGPEHFVIRILREVILKLNPEEMAGTVLAIPVANPVAFARAKRSTPEEDIDFGDMNRIFPGVRAKPAFGGGESLASDRSLTEWMAAVISEEFFPRLHYLIDFHCHWNDGALVTMLQTKNGEGETAKRSRDITRYFNLGIINENMSSGTITATGYAESLGVATTVAEIGGGAGLPERVQKKALQLGVGGVFNVLRYLKMLPGQSCVDPGRQFSAHVRPHVRPTKAGYLLTHCEPEDLFQGDSPGIPVKKGDVLAEVFDPYTLEVVEQLISPVDGIVYMTRHSGPVEAGAHGYSIADASQSKWMD